MEQKILNTAENKPVTVNLEAMEDDAPALVKKIGSMTYIVRVHFSATSKETLEEKIKRMLREAVRQS